MDWIDLAQVRDKWSKSCEQGTETSSTIELGIFFESLSKYLLFKDSDICPPLKMAIVINVFRNYVYLLRLE